MSGIIFSDLKFRGGAHVSFGGTVYESLELAITRGMYSMQIFLGNPKSFKRTIICDEDIQASKDLMQRFPMAIYSHFPYIANLAGSKNILAWNGNTEQDQKTIKALNSIEYELRIMSQFGKDNGVVIHPGNHIKENIGLEAISKSINKIKFEKNSNLLLENHAGSGTGLCTTFKQIRKIIDGVEDSKKEFVGVCVDTAHIQGVGEYDLRLISEVDRMFEEFEQILGIDKFKLLHLNDSQVCLGSRKDRHACLGMGYIWKDDMTSLMRNESLRTRSSLIHLLKKCSKLDIPIVLETHNLDMFTLMNLGI